MTYPGPQEYNEALQMPSLTILDATLRQGTVQTDALGLPFGRTGSFAITFKITSGPQTFALRCFLSNRPSIHQRYEAISAHLKQHPLPHLVDFSYETAGIRLKGDEYPILRMQWVDGVPLGLYVQEHHRNSQRMKQLQDRIVSMAKALEDAGIAHGDLQGGNILVDGSGAITLVDYDGMFVPALASLGAIETGHPNFQHPQREQSRLFTATADRFPLAVMYTALSALQEDPDIWTTLNGDEEALLFRSTDFHAPHQSTAFRALHQLPKTSEFADRLAQTATSRIKLVPSLDDFIAGRNIPQGTPLPSQQPTAQQTNTDVPWYQAVPEVRQPVEAARSQRNAERVAAMAGSRGGSAPSSSSSIAASTQGAGPRKPKGFLGIPVEYVFGAAFIGGLLLLAFLLWYVGSQSTESTSSGDVAVSDSNATVEEMLMSCISATAPGGGRGVTPCDDSETRWVVTAGGTESSACALNDVVWRNWGGDGVLCLTPLQSLIDRDMPASLRNTIGECWDSRPSTAGFLDTIPCTAITASHRAEGASMGPQQCSSNQGFAWPNSEFYMCFESMPTRSYITCVRQEGLAQECSQGLRWRYSMCWKSDSRPKLQQRIRGTWTDVTTRDFFAENDGCDPDYPWTVRFSRKATTLGTKQYRLVFPATSQSSQVVENIQVVVRETT